MKTARAKASLKCRRKYTPWHALLTACLLGILSPRCISDTASDTIEIADKRGPQPATELNAIPTQPEYSPSLVVVACYARNQGGRYPDVDHYVTLWRGRDINGFVFTLWSRNPSTHLTQPLVSTAVERRTYSASTNEHTFLDARRARPDLGANNLVNIKVRGRLLRYVDQKGSVLYSFNCEDAGSSPQWRNVMENIPGVVE